MSKMTLEKFTKALTELCKEAKHHGFYVMVNGGGDGLPEIDVTLPDGYEVHRSCEGKRHEFVFTAPRAKR